MFWQIRDNGFEFNCAEGEAAQISKIEEMFSEGKASAIGEDSYLITHEHIAALSTNERALLDLPEIFPYRLRISASGALVDRSLRYSVDFVQPNGNSFINPTVIGAHIRISVDLQYTFNIGQYLVVKKVEESNEKLASTDEVEDLTRYNFLNFADIKEVAEEIDAELDSYLKQNKVVVPKRLSILPHFEKNGDVIIAPIIMGNNGEEIPFNEDFQKSFDARDNVKTVYNGTGVYYVIKPEVEEALKEIKANHRIPKKKAKEFLKSPGSVFFSPVFDFNLADYSDRVIEIGEYKYKTEANAQSGIDWLPPEGTAFTSSDEGKNLEITLENVDEIAALVYDARKENIDFIIYQGEKYTITAKLILEIENYLEIKNKNKSGADNPTGGNLSENDDENDNENQGTDQTDGPNNGSGSRSTSGNDAETKAKPKKNGKRVLLIKDNFSHISYNAEIDTVEEIDIAEVDDCLNSGITLLNHQKQGLEWLVNSYANYKGALLADDMGLGKTLQTLAFIALTRKHLAKDKHGSVLIVAPVSLLANWQEEYSKFLKADTFEGVVMLDSETIKEYRKGVSYSLKSIAKDYLVLTSYETLRIHQFAFGKIDWGVMVLDEAQKIKNPTALVTLASKAMKYDFGLCLTGTPVENTWVDLWSIMDFAAPGYNLGSLSEFKQNYVNKLKKDNGDKEVIKELGHKLNDALNPLFMRRLKSKLSAQGELPELPKKIIIQRPEIMPLQQKIAYESIINSALDKDVNTKSALEVIAKLRDVSLFPDIGTIDERSISREDAIKIFNSSARLKVTFSELVNTYYKNEKALIFIESKKMQRILRTVIQDFFKIKVPIPINGDMRGEIRQSIVDTFNESKGFGVLLLSPLAAGMGLNIASANHVIHLSRHWNPAKEDQATDRAYRIGQTKDVQVVIPMALHPVLRLDSFDNKLDELLDFKRQLSEEALFPTADSAEDGKSIFERITKTFGGINVQTITYDINGIDAVDGITFEKIIEALYRKAGMLSARTNESNDNGADVTVFSGSKKPNLLIQCKKTKNYQSNIGKSGIQEIKTALSFYERIHTCEFKPVVITNAKGFTSGAIDLAKANGVQLICRDELAKMLELYPVEKIYI